MQEIECSKIKEKVYIETLDNGMKIMVIPKSNTKKKYAICGTHFGSMDNHFIMPKTNEEVFIPDGVAHFLEHKMFEQPDGTNSLDTLMALGLDANAYTTNDHTAYLFECTNNFYEGLDELLDYIQHPYFTDKNVEKEKGIIAQEIKMYDDDPGWQLYMNLMDCLYKKNPIKIDIAGTVESISKITPDVLYKCYNTFYHPSNMTMVVCGDFNPKEIINEINKRILLKEKQEEIKRIYPIECEDINKKEKTCKMEVSMPLFMIGFKVNNIEDTIEEVKRKIAVEIILNTIIGSSSKLYQKLYEEGLLLAPPEVDIETSKNYSHILIASSSKNPYEVKKQIDEKILEMQTNGIDKNDFERIKRKIYGSYVIEYNNVGEIARMFLTDNMNNINSFDYIEAFENVDLEYTNKILKDLLRNDKEVISIVEPKN